jgi:hypothetical protein
MPAATRPYGHLDAYVAMLAPHVDPLRSSLRFGRAPRSALVSPRLATAFKPFGVLSASYELPRHSRFSSTSSMTTMIGQVIPDREISTATRSWVVRTRDGEFSASATKISLELGMPPTNHRLSSTMCPSKWLVKLMALLLRCTAMMLRFQISRIALALSSVINISEGLGRR